jgi:hypothetical protein
VPYSEREQKEVNNEREKCRKVEGKKTRRQNGTYEARIHMTGDIRIRENYGTFCQPLLP